jgi:hypothetical protein
LKVGLISPILVICIWPSLAIWIYDEPWYSHIFLSMLNKLVIWFEVAESTSQIYELILLPYSPMAEKAEIIIYYTILGVKMSSWVAVDGLTDIATWKALTF